MGKVTFVLAAFVAAMLVTVPAFSRSQQDSQKEKPKPDSMMNCPMRNAHSGHDAHAGMNARGEGAKGMGFSQTVTGHHFLLKSDGGVIQVEVKNASDTSDRDAIRMHLTRVTHEFSQGNFAIPMFVHDSLPPGVTAMKRLREKIQYTYEEIPAGARVLIKTADPAALDAIHDFLRYQIREHQTDDPETVS